MVILIGFVLIGIGLAFAENAWFLSLILCGLGLCFISAGMGLSHDKNMEKREAETKAIVHEKESRVATSNRTRILQQGYTASRTFTCTRDNAVLQMSLDESKKVLLLFLSNGKYTIPFQDITDVERNYIDHTTGRTVTTKNGGVGRAIVGGALAGGAGAIVGASTARSQGQSYSSTKTVIDSVTIFINNISTPSIIVSGTDEFNEKVYSTVLVIKNQNNSAK